MTKHQEDLAPLGFIFANIAQSLIATHMYTSRSSAPWRRTTRSSSVVWISTDAQISTRLGHDYCIHASSALLTEAQACLHALTWAHERNHKCLSIYTNSTILVNYLHHVPKNCDTPSNGSFRIFYTLLSQHAGVISPRFLECKFNKLMILLPILCTSLAMFCLIPFKFTCSNAHLYSFPFLLNSKLFFIK